MTGKRKTYRRWIVLGCGVAAAGVLAGGVVGAQVEGPLSEDVAASLRTAPLTKVADITAANGLEARGVFVQPAASGLLCLWDAPSATSLTRLGGCNRSSDPLGGKKMTISFSQDGGPALSDVKDARIIGLTSIDVAAVQVLMTDGTRRDVKLKRTPAIARVAGSYLAFGYRLKQSDLRQAVGPAAVVALDATGQEIDRQQTGFGG